MKVKTILISLLAVLGLSGFGAHEYFFAENKTLQPTASIETQPEPKHETIEQTSFIPDEEIEAPTSTPQPQQTYISQEQCSGFILEAYELGYTVQDILDFLATEDYECYNNLSSALDVVYTEEEEVESPQYYQFLNDSFATDYDFSSSYKYEDEEESNLPPFLIGGTSHTNSLGITNYNNDDGSYGTSHTNSLGFTHYSDSEGRTIDSHTNSLGFTNSYDNEGNSTTSHTNSLGITSYYGNDGYSGTSHTNSLGFTNYYDNQGNSQTCHTNSLGFTTCY